MQAEDVEEIIRRVSSYKVQILQNELTSFMARLAHGHSCMRGRKNCQSHPNLRVTIQYIIPKADMHFVQGVLGVIIVGADNQILKATCEVCRKL